jgi:hypothetical protein
MKNQEAQLQLGASSRQLAARLTAILEAFSPYIVEAVASIGPTDFPDRWAEFEKKYTNNIVVSAMDRYLTQICSDIIGTEQVSINGNGGFGIWPERLRTTIEDRIAAGDAPEAIASETVDLFTNGEAGVHWVFGIAGIEIEHPIEIGEGITLLHPTGVLPSKMREKRFGISIDGRHIIDALPNDATAALVFAFPKEKVVFHQEDELPKNRFGSIYESMQNVIDACVLSGASSTNYVFQYIHIDHPAAGYNGFFGGYAYPQLLPDHFHPEPLNEEAFLKLFGLLGSSKTKLLKAIRPIIERYRRSNWSGSIDGQALDLGLAAEMMLMHGDSKDNTEIGNKISTRGAWLIGSDYDTRVQIFNIIRGLYKARSDAAHRGLVREENTKHIENARPVVQDLINKILNDGEFPDWNAVVLGRPQNPVPAAVVVEGE